MHSLYKLDCVGRGECLRFRNFYMLITYKTDNWTHLVFCDCSTSMQVFLEYFILHWIELQSQEHNSRLLGHPTWDKRNALMVACNDHHTMVYEISAISLKAKINNGILAYAMRKSTGCVVCLTQTNSWFHLHIRLTHTNTTTKQVQYENADEFFFT